MLYTNAVGDAGEFYFAYRVASDLRWPCRLIEIDIGIDAQIEILDDDRRSTGKFVAIQVKTTDVGAREWRVSRRHIRYWNSISVPVFVALVDLRTSEVFLHRVKKEDDYLGSAKKPVPIKFTSADIMNGTTAQMLRRAASEAETEVLSHLDEIAESARAASPLLKSILENWDTAEPQFVRDAILISVRVLSEIEEGRVLARHHPDANAKAWEEIEHYLELLEDLRTRMRRMRASWSEIDRDGTFRPFMAE